MYSEFGVIGSRYNDPNDGEVFSEGKARGDPRLGRPQRLRSYQEKVIV